jgi:hypothetical protein
VRTTSSRRRCCCPIPIEDRRVEICRCWDGVNLDSPDHRSHVAYPESGSFESGGPCPASHPVHIPQILYEVAWDTRAFNDPNDWPEDGSQPFVFSMGDPTGYVSAAVKMFSRRPLT